MFYIEDGDIQISNEEKKEYDDLIDLYNKAQNLADLRSKKLQDAQKDLNNKIKEVDKIYLELKNDELRRLARVVKGTILFRKAQILDVGFENAEQYYEDAYAFLGRNYASDKYDILNELFLLNLGKCLRNMGMHGHRSDYDRALDCLEELQKRIEKRIEKSDECTKLKRWETCLWLEVRVNIGRIHKYLYNLEEAKNDFWDILHILLAKGMKHCEKVNTTVDKDCLLKKDKEKAGKTSYIEKYLLYSEKEYEEYLQQVLVELGTVYLKERYLEAAKNLFLLTYEINEKNVDAKNNIAVYLRKRNEQGDYQKAIQILRTQAEEGNRFAQINIFKCQIALIGNRKENAGNEEKEPQIRKILGECKEFDKTYYDEEKLKKELEKEIAEQPEDLELRLLSGLYYKKKKYWDKALAEFEYIYQKSPYIRKGTLGLKAYYNIIQDLIRKQQFYQAKAGLEQIIAECKRDFKGESQEQIDFLAEMDLGWCLLNIGYYVKAQECYEKLLESEQVRKEHDSRYCTKKWNLIRVLNNLGECYLYQGKNDDAYGKFETVLGMEKDNSRANRSLGQYYMQLARECKKKEDYIGEKTNLKKAIESFEEASDMENNDIKINSGLVVALFKILNDESEKDIKLINSFEENLRFSNRQFSMRACFAFANYIEGVKDKKHQDILYRAFAKIKLGSGEEAYTVFEHFRNDNAIRRLPTEARGKILAKIFQIYKEILAIKKLCRYTPKGTEEKVVPVHYTTLKTLKILLNDEPDANPRLRLWNTADMNDTYEGEVFIELLKEVSKDIRKNEQERAKAQSEAQEKVQAEEQEEPEVLMAKYFKHLSNSANSLVPSNGNVYIISFTKREDFIPMWNTYAEDAKGCSLTFGDDFFDIKNETDMYTSVSSYSDKSYSLYQVLYLNPNGAKEAQDTGEFIEVKEHLTRIWKLLTAFEAYLKKEMAGDEKKLWKQAIEVSRKVIADFLNEIRFLFKYNEYGYEEEVRLIKCSYEPKLDRKNFEIPRLYIEVDKDINKLKEVCLGKKISQGEINQLVSWLYGTEKVEHITISSIHYQ